MNIDEFIKSRVDDQITWHSKKAKCYKVHYYVFAIIAMVLSIAAATVICPCMCISRILSIIVAVSIGLESICNFKDKWILYRNTAEALKSEKVKYLARKEPLEEIDEEFIRAIEDILSQTNNEWQHIAKKTSNS